MDLKAKYPTSHHPPKKDCYKCKGTGEILVKEHLYACICLFVDHEFSNEIGKHIGAKAKQLKKEFKL